MSQVIQQKNEGLVGVHVTEAATRHLVSFLSDQEGSIGLRLSVKKTGCSGLSYVLDYLTRAEDKDLVFPFTGSWQIYIDRSSYPYLKGMNIDYVKQGLSHKLVFNNPNQTGQCGCGESFTVE